MIGLFCKRTLQKRLYSAKETYNFNEPTNRSQPIAVWVECVMYIEPISEYRLFYRALLQKRLMILRSLLIVASPYSELQIRWHRILRLFLQLCQRTRILLVRFMMSHDIRVWDTTVECVMYIEPIPEHRLFCRALLQKRPMILRSLPVRFMMSHWVILNETWYSCVRHDCGMCHVHRAHPRISSLL